MKKAVVLLVSLWRRVVVGQDLTKVALQKYRTVVNSALVKRF